MKEIYDNFETFKRGFMTRGEKEDSAAEKAYERCEKPNHQTLTHVLHPNHVISKKESHAKALFDENFRNAKANVGKTEQPQRVSI